LYRGKWLFEKQRFKVITYKVDYKVPRSLKTKIIDFLPDTENLKQTGTRELIGRLIYLLNN
jgi:hypothetical protein